MGLCRNDSVWMENCVVGYLCAVFDNGKLALQKSQPKRFLEDSRTHNDAILANFDVTANGGRFYDGVCTNMDVITNTHGVVIEVPFESFVWWSGDPFGAVAVGYIATDKPDYTPFAN